MPVYKYFGAPAKYHGKPLFHILSNLKVGSFRLVRSKLPWGIYCTFPLSPPLPLEIHFSELKKTTLINLFLCLYMSLASAIYHLFIFTLFILLSFPLFIFFPFLSLSNIFQLPPCLSIFYCLSFKHPDHCYIGKHILHVF